MSSRLSALLVALAVLLAASCLTPSVPVPPPEPEKMSFDVDVDAGTASFRFARDDTFSLAVVYVFNRDKGVGIIDTARVDGSVGPTQPFDAELGDEILITFEKEQALGTTCVVLRQGQSDSGQECSP